MTKKKRAHPDVEEILQRPWCYYCERDFDDLKILISHQKAKHFKCERCGRRLNTAGGLSVHMNQVHKEQLTQVENALPNRNEVGIEIFGMEGIPEDVLSAHRQRVTEAFFRFEAERRALTGNPPAGGQKAAGPGGEAKKPKIESAEDIKKRLAEHKARKAAEKAGLDSPAARVKMEDFGEPPTSSSPQTGAPFQPPYGVPNINSPQPGFNPYQPPPQQQGYPNFAGSPAAQQPYQPPNAFSPSGQQPYQPPNAFSPSGQGMPMHGYPSFQNQPPQPPFSGAPPMSFGGPPSAGPYGHGQQWSPPNQPPSAGPYGHGQQSSPPGQPPSTGPPPSAPGMTPGLPQPAPGLPQRPSFQAPNLSKEEMAKMHSGAPIQHANGGWNFSSQPPHPTKHDDSIGDSVDDLINSVTGQGSYAKPNPTPVPASDPEPVRATPIKTESPAPTTMAPPVIPTSQSKPAVAAAASSGKKDKKKKKHGAESKLIYSDELTSPEEKMAQKARYTFKRDDHTEMVLGEISGAVTGRVDDTVRDPQDASGG